MYTVIVHAEGNPDIGQYAPVALTVQIEAKTPLGLVKRVMKHIAKWNLGAGNFAPEPVMKAGERYAEISYNGRLWK